MGPRRTRRGRRVVILLENLPLQRDSRVRRQCRSLLDAGYDVTVICPTEPEKHLDPALAAVRLLTYPRRDARTTIGFFLEYLYSVAATAVLLAVAAVSRGVDLIQACNPPDVLWLIALPYRPFGIPFVFDHHDLSPELFEARFESRGFLHRSLLGAERGSVHFADHVIEANETMRDIVVGRTGASPDEVTVVRNGPMLRQTGAGAVEPDSRLKQGRAWLVCWHGIMGHEDGLDIVVRAAASLVHDLGRTDCTFALVGDGDVRRDTERLVDDLHIREWVTFPGWLSQDEVYRYLATADVGLSADPSGQYRDWSTPIKAVEYMSFGVPVIGFESAELITTTDGAAEIVPENSPSLMAKAIDQLLADPDRRRRMGAHGRSRVETTLAWDHQSTYYVAVMDQLLNNRKGAA